MRPSTSLWVRKIAQGPHSDSLWKVYKHIANPEVSEGYYVSDTVLDLDAHGSLATRPYTNADTLEQIKKWSTNPALVALQGRMRAFKGEVEQAKALWRRRPDRFDARRVTERDILSLAFHGAAISTLTGLPYPFLMDTGILRRVAQDVPLTIRYLNHRQKSQFRYNPRCSEADELKSRLLNADPNCISRILYPLLHLDEGCILISDCAREIIVGLAKDIVTMTPGQALRIAMFLRNVSYNMAARNLNFEPLALEQTLGRLYKRFSTDNGDLDDNPRTLCSDQQSLAFA